MDTAVDNKDVGTVADMDKVVDMGKDMDVADCRSVPEEVLGGILLGLDILDPVVV
jgi:hypothetical protein